MMIKPIIILMGPTASGKSELALNVADKINAVIINCDSKQVYREIPIITAQPSEEEQSNIAHELYGQISAAEDCSVGRWINMATVAIDRAHEQGKVPLLVGGTGMYVKSLMQGLPVIPDISDGIRQGVRSEISKIGAKAMHAKLAIIDKDMADRLEENDSQRIARAFEVIEQTGKSLLYWQQQPHKQFYPKECFKTFFLSKQREIIYENCNLRFDRMIQSGVLDEMRKLADMKLDPDLPAMRAHGVPELLAYLQGNMSLDEAVEISKKNTRHYIKRQFTWFKHQVPDAIILESTGKSQVKLCLQECHRMLKKMYTL